MQDNVKLQTGEGVKTPTVLHGINRNVITTGTKTGELRNLYRIKTKGRSRKVLIRAIGLKERRLKNKKYTLVKADTDNSVALESAVLIQTSIDTVAQTGGMIRTAVNGTVKGAETIKTISKNGITIGSKKDVGKIATAVGGSISNIAKDTGKQLLKTKIDKSTVTDTGSETMKQGLTELRYIDNARKAVLNTARTSVKAGYAIKNMPKDTRVQARRIRNNIKKARVALQKTAEVIKKIFSSKAGLIIIGAIAGIIILVILINGIVMVIASMISSLFSWLSSPEDADTQNQTLEMLNYYNTTISECIEYNQDEIDSIVDGFVIDRRQYPPYELIYELDQFGNQDIVIENNTEIIAILAVLRYRELDNGNTDIELNFTDEEISEVVDKFYTFNYWYEYGNCSSPYCKNEVTTTVYNEGTENEYVETTTTYYCDVSHQWLYGEVDNHTIDEVLTDYNFTDEEKDLYTMYVEQIKIMLEVG